jgi:hypothetical protein
MLRPGDDTSSTIPWARQENAGLARLVRRAVSLLKTDGPVRVAIILLRLILSPIVEFGRLVFFVRDLDGEWSTPRAPDGLQLRLASPSDACRLISGGRPDLALTEERFRRGDRCVVAVAPDGSLPHSRWITEIATPIPELKMHIRPRPHEAYFYDGYTRPAARGLGIDAVARCFIFDMLRAEKVNRVYSYVRGDNGPGLRAASRRQRDIGEIWYVRIRGFRACMIERRRNPGAASAGHDGRVEWPEVR